MKPNYEAFSTFWINVLDRLGAKLDAAPRFSKLCLAIAMADRRLLAQAPRHEAHVLASLGGLMLLAATWTGVGMASRLAAGLMLWPLAFAFFFAVALGLERVVLGTFKPGKSRLNVALRVTMALALCTLQVAPTVTSMFHAQIVQFAHNESLRGIGNAAALAGSAHGVAALEAKSADLAHRADVAREMLTSPPQDARVLGAEQQLAAAKRDAARAERELASAQTKLNRAREVASVGSARERKSAEALAAKYAVVVADRTERARKAKLAVDTAQQGVGDAKAAQTRDLQEALDQAVAAARAHDQTLAQAREATSRDVADAEALAHSARDAASLATDAVFLLKVAAHDGAVATVVAFIFLCAVLLDLTPLAVKWALASDSTYARIIDCQADRIRAGLDHLARMDALAREEERLRAENHVAAVRIFADRDAGAAEAAQLGLGVQQQLDAQRLRGAVEIYRQGFDEIELNLDAVLRLQQTVDKNPELLRPIFENQLTSLLAKVERAAAEAQAAMSPSPETA